MRVRLVREALCRASVAVSTREDSRVPFGVTFAATLGSGYRGDPSWCEGNWTVLEIRLVFRGLRRAPGFATATVVALAIGIGGSALIFSVVDTLRLGPLPYADPERLVTIDPPVVDWAIFEQLPTSDTAVKLLAARRDPPSLQADTTATSSPSW
jgi:hypothetical protein